MREVSLSLATPMLGGGWKAGQVDRSWPIRPSAIRGALRWWWRATTGTLIDQGSLWEREADLWGAATGEKESKVIVSIKTLANIGTPRQLDRNGIPPYAIGQLNLGGESKQVLDRAEFTLSIEGHLLLTEAQAHEVGLALDCLVLFGGLGARTTRGFGTLEVKSANGPHFSATAKTLQETEPRCFSETFRSAYGLRIVLSRKSWKSASDAWGASLAAFANFRKAERNDGGARKSPNRWPEADALRGALETSGGRIVHKNGPNSLPRAEFGLPLTFRSLKGHHGFFGDATISAYGGEDNLRLMSPVICKAIRDGATWRGGAILLRRERLKPDQLIFKEPRLRGSMFNTDATGFPDKLMGSSGNQESFHQPHPDPLDAFAHYLTSHAGWTEVL